MWLFVWLIFRLTLLTSRPGKLDKKFSRIKGLSSAPKALPTYNLQVRDSRNPFLRRQFQVVKDVSDSKILTPLTHQNTTPTPPPPSTLIQPGDLTPRNLAIWPTLSQPFPQPLLNYFSAHFIWNEFQKRNKLKIVSNDSRVYLSALIAPRPKFSKMAIFEIPPALKLFAIHYQELKCDRCII